MWEFIKRLFRIGKAEANNAVDKLERPITMTKQKKTLGLLKKTRTNHRKRLYTCQVCRQPCLLSYSSRPSLRAFKASI